MKKIFLTLLLAAAMPIVANAETRETYPAPNRCSNIYLMFNAANGAGASGVQTYIPLTKFQQSTFGSILNNSESVNYTFKSTGEELSLAYAYEEEIMKIVANKYNFTAATYKARINFPLGENLAAVEIYVKAQYKKANSKNAKTKTSTIKLDGGNFRLFCAQ